jgi:hypothetical protein
MERIQFNILPLLAIINTGNDLNYISQIEHFAGKEVSDGCQ